MKKLILALCVCLLAGMASAGYVDQGEADTSGLATGTPLYVESDPIWVAASGSYVRIVSPTNEPAGKSTIVGDVLWVGTNVAAGVGLGDNNVWTGNNKFEESVTISNANAEALLLISTSATQGDPGIEFQNKDGSHRRWRMQMVDDDWRVWEVQTANYIMSADLNTAMPTIYWGSKFLNIQEEGVAGAASPLFRVSHNTTYGTNSTFTTPVVVSNDLYVTERIFLSRPDTNSWISAGVDGSGIVTSYLFRINGTNLWLAPN